MATQNSWWLSDTALLIYLALVTVIVHMLVGQRYGFHRDELATLDDARHLAWGYVAYPPVTPFFGRLSLILFGPTLPGFRLFAAVAQAVAVVLTGLMAKEMGGRRGARLVSAFAAIPFCLGGGALMQYVSFDYLCWALAAYFVVRLLQSDDPRWWLAVGAAIGFGMLSKYTMGVFAVGIVASVLLTDARRYLRSKWLWFGVALSILIFLPNLLWQAQNHFVSADFLKHIHERDVRLGRTKDFLPGQLKMTLLAFPLCLAGLYHTLVSQAGKRFRAIGWMFLVPLVLFVVLKGRVYYFGAAYPMVYAAGSVWVERWLASLRLGWAAALRAAAVLALAVDIVIATMLALPVAPVHSKWWSIASKIQGDFVEEFGWPELVETVAHIRDALPPEERARAGILAANYGEAGAINLFGPQYGLPPVISGVNSFWARGYGDPPPDTLIVLGHSRGFLAENFDSCQVVAHSWNRFGVENEETLDHSDIYVCRGLKSTWPEFWTAYRHFG
ncbi:MAG TPA: glycosyltransferase family 39 protein [Candidatus Acidoferrum sp.]|nr:glycosyltransferase family 39 protein [Candidatus Acidoferrum sp.]